MVIDAVAAFDLSAFYAVYRTDGHGRPAHDPAMMVALLLLRRGRSAARSEWRLTNAAHNLLKLWRHTSAPTAA